MKASILFPTIAIAALGTAQAANISISFTNAGNSDFFLTPLWYGLHDGTSDTFDPGASASAALELLAEEGNGSLLSTAVDSAGGQSGMIANAAGFGGAPVIDPGETATASITVASPSTNRYFNFASMVIPTNDAFIANGNPLAYELFDANGNFNGPVTITILASQIWDAGTEVNNTQGAPFSVNGGNASTDEGGVIALVTNDLAEFSGLERPASLGAVSDLLTGSEVVGTITIVPEPSSTALAGLGVLGLLTRRRR